MYWNEYIFDESCIYFMQKNNSVLYVLISTYQNVYLFKKIEISFLFYYLK